jgi:hypothetical protein
MASKKEPERPAEDHQTAAWANKAEICVPGFVPHPDKADVVRAKEYADSNEK